MNQIMAKMKTAVSATLPGMLGCGFFALIAYGLSLLDSFKAYSINSLVLAIIIGIIIGNALHKYIPARLRPGIAFSSKRILRLAIILYGFRITFGQIAQVGMVGLVADAVMLVTTYCLGYFVGTRLMKLDKDLTILTTIGASVCGAAAVLGTDAILKAKAHKVSLAVATVVLFGTIAMFLYPLIYKLGFMDAGVFGIYIGSSVHEVAQVVAAGGAISPAAMDTAVIVKLTRVMMLVPFLFGLSFMVSRKAGGGKVKVQIPWFAVLFVVMCGVNSMNIIPARITSGIVAFDVFLLTMAMFALGVDTNLEKIKGLGLKPVLLALVMFVWLVCFGFALNSLVT